MTLLLLLVIFWYVIGVFSFIYWWTSEYDLEPYHLMIGIAVGVLGPFTYRKLSAEVNFMSKAVKTTWGAAVALIGIVLAWMGIGQK